MSLYEDVRGAFGQTNTKRSNTRPPPVRASRPPVENYRDDRRRGSYRDDRSRGGYRDDRSRGGYRDDRRRDSYRDDRRRDDRYRRGGREPYRRRQTGVSRCRDSRDSYRNSRDKFNRGGARHLARIHGTEDDRVNCPFFFKIGACRHGDRCGRLHSRPAFSQTVLIPHMYSNPKATAQLQCKPVDESKMMKEFEEFYEEIFDKFAEFGYVEDVHVCENLGEHMVGNVYVKYRNEEDADKCVKALTGKFYGGRPLLPEFSPVTDFYEARCRQYDEMTCSRGGLCNFMHCIRVSRSLKRELIEDQSEPEESESDSSSSSSEDDDDERDSRRRRRRDSRSRSRSREKKSSSEKKDDGKEDNAVEEKKE